MEKTWLSIGIIGGIGLGLMLGSEFSGRYITILGAILVTISLVAMGVLSYRGKKWIKCGWFKLQRGQSINHIWLYWQYHI